jgi:hypothetical protein
MEEHVRGVVKGLRLGFGRRSRLLGARSIEFDRSPLGHAAEGGFAAAEAPQFFKDR